MDAPLAEIEYQLTEDDYIQMMRLAVGSKQKDPLISARIQIAAYGVLATLALLFAIWIVSSGRYEKHLQWAVLSMGSAAGWKAYQAVQRIRALYASIRKETGSGERRLLKIYPDHFSIVRPGRSEFSMKWEMITRVDLTTHYLFIQTIEETRFWIPARFVAPGDWEALCNLLEAA